MSVCVSCLYELPFPIDPNSVTFNPDLHTSLECPASQRKPPTVKPPEDSIGVSEAAPPENFEPLIRVMKAIYKWTDK